MPISKKLQGEILKITIGCVLYALSVVLFIDPVKIIPGSVTGVGVVVKALTGFPIGILSIIINVPLVIYGTVVLGRKLLIYTGLTVILSSVLIDALAFLPPFTDDILMASVFGGVVMGLSLGLILSAGGTTGGTTIVGRLVVRKRPTVPIGNILLIGDFVIIVVGAVLLRDWNLMLYSLINLYVCVVVINKVIYGTGLSSASIIFTAKGRELEARARAVMDCRFLHGSDGLAVCISRKKDVSKLQNLITGLDHGSSCASFDLDYSFGHLMTRIGRSK